MKKAVKMMCQIDGIVWMASDNGMLTAVSAHTYSIEHQATKPEFARQDLVGMVAIDDQAGLFALAYTGSLVYFVSFNFAFLLKSSGSFVYSVMDEVATEQKGIKVFDATVSSLQIFSIEVCRQEDADLVEVWCGCDGGVIEVYTPPDDDSDVALKTKINTYLSSPDIPQDSNIIQLKSYCLSVGEMHVLSLHGCGRVISCWIVSDQPTLLTVIKPSPRISPSK